MMGADRMVRAIAVWSLLLIAGAAHTAAAAHGEQTYTDADFERVRKFDAHVHANTDDQVFLEIARKDGFEILSINVDYPDFPSLGAQARIAHKLQAADPGHFHFATSFSMAGFGGDRWTQDTIRKIDSEIQQGALGDGILRLGIALDPGLCLDQAIEGLGQPRRGPQPELRQEALLELEEDRRPQRPERGAGSC